MKKSWDKVIELAQKLINDDAVVINGLRGSGNVSKIKKTFEQNVKHLSRALEEMNVFVPDPERDEIILPFDGEAFAEAWDDYKEFMREVFDIVLVPVEERRRLKKLHRIASKNEETAIEIVDFLITSRYKSIFKPEKLQLTGEQPDAEETETKFTIKKNTL